MVSGVVEIKLLCKITQSSHNLSDLSNKYLPSHTHTHSHTHKHTHTQAPKTEHCGFYTESWLPLVVVCKHTELSMCFHSLKTKIIFCPAPIFPTCSTPHRKPESAQVNGRLSACSGPSKPAEAAVSPAQRKQYNSPIGLYSEETLREMTLLQAGG